MNYKLKMRRYVKNKDKEERSVVDTLNQQLRDDWSLTRE